MTKKGNAIKISAPQIPVDCKAVSDFYALAEEAMEEEISIRSVFLSDESAESGFFKKLEIRGGRVRNSAFCESNFSGGSFVDLEFSGCDFSGCDFTGAYFERCNFSECKLLGVNMSESILKDVEFSAVKLRYAVFDQAKIARLSLKNTDFTEGSMSEVTLKGLLLKDSTLVHCNFFKTSLKGTDLTDTVFSAPILSSPPEELRGATVTPLQAIELMSLLGIEVQE